MWGESESGYYGQESLTWVQSSVIVLDGVLTGSPWLETPQATELIALIVRRNMEECHNCSLIYSLTSSKFPLRTVIIICSNKLIFFHVEMISVCRRLHMGVGPCNCLERNPQHKGCISFTSSESRKAHLPINPGFNYSADQKNSKRALCSFQQNQNAAQVDLLKLAE
ncbi:unnamed protein product [Musa acuminata subsp. burmannicoides]